MTEEIVENSTIRKYLLGDLPESEAEQVEKWYFGGGQAVDEVWEVFSELAEERLSGSLTENEAQRFEQKLQSSPALLEMFENEKAIREYAASNATAASRKLKDNPGPVGRRPWRLPALFFKSPRIVAPGVVAIVVLGAFGLWLLLRAPNSPNPEGAQQQARAQNQKDFNSVTQPSSDQRQSPRPGGAAIGETNDRLPEEKKAAIAQPDQKKSAMAAAGRETMATLLLLAGGTRGAENYPTLVIPGQTETARLEFEPPSDSCAVFSAVLQTESGEEIQRWKQLRARRAYSSLRLARLLVQADSLRSARYVVKLKCVSSSINSEPGAEYRFNVEKK